MNEEVKIIFCFKKKILLKNPITVKFHSIVINPIEYQLKSEEKNTEPWQPEKETNLKKKKNEQEKKKIR